MKKLVIGGICLIFFFMIALNTTMLAEQAEQWVKNNPKDPHAPQVLFDAARWCDILGDNHKAQTVYDEIFRLYPENSAISAAALFYEAQNKVQTSAATKSYAIPILDTLISQYPDQTEWAEKGKKLRDEVIYVR